MVKSKVIVLCHRAVSKAHIPMAVYLVTSSVSFS